MTQNHYLWVLAVLFSLIVADVARAQPAAPVDIILKSKKAAPIKDAVIAEESVKGIRISGKADLIASEDIEDVIYTNRIAAAATRIIYNNAVTEENTAAQAGTRVKRDEHLEKALAKYQEALKDMPKDLFAPRRHAEFKVAYLTALLGLGSDKQIYRVDGIKKLNDFKKAHADSWQFTPALLMLVKLHAEQKNFDEVRSAAKELAAANVSPKIKSEAKMLVVRLIMDDGKVLEQQKQLTEAVKKYAEAQKELDSMLPELSKDSPLKLHAELLQAQCKAVTGDKNTKLQVTKDLEKLLKDTSDKELRPVIYNTLGELYLKDGKLQEARWQFLWVDVVYNQDKEEHARALYNLWKIFNVLNEPERGQDFFEELTINARFAGTYYRDKALKENKETP